MVVANHLPDSSIKFVQVIYILCLSKRIIL